jgi:cob(I)alamin adenosyltransferase
LSETSPYASTKALEAQITEIGKAKAKLLEFPSLLADAQRVLSEAKEQLRTWQAKLADVSAELMIQVQQEVEETKDPDTGDLRSRKVKYSNDQARKVAHTKLLASDAEAAALQEQVDRFGAAARAAEQQLNRLENDRRAWESYQYLSMKQADLMLGLNHLSLAALGYEGKV